jgi:hypothetical protein
MPRPSYFSQFYQLNNIVWAVQIIKFLIINVKEHIILLKIIFFVVLTKVHYTLKLACIYIGYRIFIKCGPNLSSRIPMWARLLFYCTMGTGSLFRG